MKPHKSQIQIAIDILEQLNKYHTACGATSEFWESKSGRKSLRDSATLRKAERILREEIK